MTGFDLFVGADWSGERGPRVKRLQVAACGAGQGAPSLVANPSGGAWTRPGFAAWLLARARERRVLCGLDFSFCFPWEDRQAYFPGFADDPADHAGFWALVEALCVADDGLFGGGLADVEPLHHHFRRGAVTGACYARRLRVVEALTGERGLGVPESVFNLVGARQVGKASLSGMRMLRWLRRHDGVAVWPFDEIGDTRLVLVEAFPTAFVRMAGGGSGKVRDGERLNRVLKHFSSRPILKTSCHPGEGRDPERGRDIGLRPLGPGLRRDDSVFEFTDDMTDALVSSAALRALSPNPSLWHPPGLSDRVRRFEGWTFGIT